MDLLLCLNKEHETFQRTFEVGVDSQSVNLDWAIIAGKKLLPVDQKIVGISVIDHVMAK